MEKNRARNKLSVSYLRRNPGASGLCSGLHILSRSPSSLVCASIDSSLTGGDRELQAGLDESVRNDSLPLNNTFWNNKEKYFFRSTVLSSIVCMNVTWSKPPSPTHFGGAKADGSGKLDGNGLTNAPPPLNGLPVVFAVDTAGCKKWGGNPCSKCAP